MEYILKNSLSFNLKVLRAVGLYPSENHNSKHKCFAYILNMISVSPPFVLGSLNFFLHGDIERENYNDFLTAGLILLTPKLLLFLLNRYDIQKCINYFSAVFPLAVNDTQKKIIGKSDKICRRNSTVFFISACLGMLSLFVIWYFQDYHTHLPLNVWLPFNSKTHPGLYCCVYVMLVIGNLYYGFACTTIDTLVSGLFCHASGQLKLLKENLQNLDLYVDEEMAHISRKPYRAIVIYERIRQSVRHYKDIINFVNECENCFSAMVFSQFMESIVAIGLCCLQLIKIQDLNPQSFIMVIYLAIILFEVYFYCYYGSTVFEENNSVCSAIYMSNWYEYDIACRRALLILMERSMRPMLLTAEKVLELSLQTFTMILKTSYSLIAVLKNF